LQPNRRQHFLNHEGPKHNATDLSTRTGDRSDRPQYPSSVAPGWCPARSSVFHPGPAAWVAEEIVADPSVGRTGDWVAWLAAASGRSSRFVGPGAVGGVGDDVVGDGVVDGAVAAAAVAAVVVAAAAASCGTDSSGECFETG